LTRALSNKTNCSNLKEKVCEFGYFGSKLKKENHCLLKDIKIYFMYEVNFIAKRIFGKEV